MKATFRIVASLLMALALMSVSVKAQNGHSLQDFLSPDPSVRMAAFYALIQPGSPIDETTRVALFDLLTRETAYIQSLDQLNTDNEDDEFASYFANLVDVVASLRDIRSLNALADLIQSGSIVTDTLASFGAPALDVVVARVTSTDPRVTTGAVIVLKGMLSPENVALVSDTVSLAKIADALDVASSSPSRFTRQVAAEAKAALPTIDIVPPVTTAVVTPSANASGWHNTNVIVTLNSTDSEPGGTGVKQIRWSLAGAQTGSTTVPGSTATVTISTEGVTTLTFFGTDNAGNVESAKTLTVQLDKTPPTITPVRTPAPNANGWNNTNVTVSFACADALSGLAAGSPPAPTVLATEGKGQSVTGTCTDLAGNSGSSIVSGINIDKTPPTVACSASPNILWPPNNKLVPISLSVKVTDALSGPAGFTLVSVTSNEPDSKQGDIEGFAPGTESTTGQLRAQRLGSGTGRVYTFTYSGADRAGNTTSCTTAVSVPHDQGRN